jgi:hypothetical protein
MSKKALTCIKIVVPFYLAMGFVGFCDLLAAITLLCVLQLARVLPVLSLLELP